MAVVHGRISLVGNVNNPDDALFRRAPTRCKHEVRKNLEAGVQMVGPECAIPLQTPIESLRAIREAVLEWHGPETVLPRRPADEEPMPELTDVSNDFIRQEIEEFVERPDERERMIGLFAAASRPSCRTSPRRLIDGDDETVDALTPGAVDAGTSRARGDGRRADRRHGDRRHQVPRELHLRARGACLRARHEGRDGAHRADPLGLGHRAHREGRDGHRQGRPARHRQEPRDHDAARLGLRGGRPRRRHLAPTTSSTPSRSTSPRSSACPRC